MTVHQLFYDIDKANMQELYIIWTVAALMIIIPAVVFWIWNKKGE